MNGEGVHSFYEPHSLGKEAVQHPTGSASNAPVPFARWQEGEQSMGGVVWVCDYGDCSAYAALLVNLLQGREGAPMICTGSLHNPVELYVLSSAAAKPGCEAVHQDTFNGALVKGAFLSLQRGWRHFCAFFTVILEVHP